MKSVFKLALLAAVGLPAVSQAQLVVDRSKYPDYDPTVRSAAMDLLIESKAEKHLR